MHRAQKHRSAKLTVSDLSDRQRRIFDFLYAHPVGVLSSVTPDNDPHGVVVYFAVDKQFGISLLTRADTHKHDNLVHNTHVMLTVFDMASQATVQLMGVAQEVTGSDGVKDIATAIYEASRRLGHVGLLPISKLQAGAYVGFVIRPAQVRMAVYGVANGGDYTELFESVESYELEAD